MSKHRGTIFSTGQARLDPPDGFLESLGATHDPTLRMLMYPMASIRPKSDPKLPAASRRSTPARAARPLEDLVPEFAVFINRTGELALEDARSSISLKEPELRVS